MVVALFPAAYRRSETTKIPSDRFPDCSADLSSYKRHTPAVRQMWFEDLALFSYETRSAPSESFFSLQDFVRLRRRERANASELGKSKLAVGERCASPLT